MKCPTPSSVHNPKTDSYILVPCGSCGACYSNRRADWSFRLKWEQKQSIGSAFLTFTYSDEHLVFDGHSGVATLQKQDMQKLIKRLRKYQKQYIDIQFRYFLVGEYGGLTARPHYHLLAFNILPQTIKQLDKLWTYGTVHVGEVEDKSIHYITKFHVNGITKYDDRNDEFSTMSRNPGIGNNYIDKNRKWHYNNRAKFVINNGFKQRLPRYYNEKIFDKITSDSIILENLNELDESYKKQIETVSKKYNINNSVDADRKLQENYKEHANNYTKKSERQKF